MNTWEQQYPLSEGGGVIVEQQSGPVVVSAWDQPAVKVTASSQAGLDLADELEIEQNQRGLSIRVKQRWFRWGQSIRLDVQVPVGAPCRVESGSGPVEVSDTQAALEIETGSGNVTIQAVGHANVETGSGAVSAFRVNGALALETGSGNVELSDINGTAAIDVGSGHVNARRINGDLRAETGSGRLTVEDVAGRVELNTGSGSLSVERVRGGFLSAETGGGSLRLKGIDVTQLEANSGSGGIELELLALYPGGSYQVETGSGGATVALPPDSNVAVNVEAQSGRVSFSGLDLRIRRQEDGELEATMGEGGARLEIEAGSGTIQLRPLAAGARGGAPAASHAAAQVMEAVKGDAALESSDQLQRIVAMVEQGKLTPAEAEELLRALDEEDTTA